MIAFTADPDAVRATLVSAIRRIVGSKLLLLTAFGLALIVLGGFFLDGTLAGMFGIWGTTFVLVGAVGLVVFFAVYRPR